MLFVLVPPCEKERSHTSQTLVYRSDSLSKPIIVIETKLAPGILPTVLTAQLTFNGVAGTTYSFDTESLGEGQSIRIALQADGTSLTSGMHDYSVKLTTTVDDVSEDQLFTGQHTIVNRGSSEFGSNWWLEGLDRLIDSSAGALVIMDNGDSLWFKKSGSNYLAAAGDLINQTLVKNVNNTFTITSKYGNKKHFSTTGLLTSTVDSNSLELVVTKLL